MADYDLKVVSWDGNNINDGTNYTSGFVPAKEWGLPAVTPQLVKRDGAWPLVGGVDRPGEDMRIQIHIKGSSKRTLRDQIMRWFDPEDETPKKLIVEDEDGSNDRYKYAVCKDILPIPAPNVGSRDAFYILLTTHGDVRWRETSLTTPSSWNVTASGQTRAFTNNGTDDAYPIIEIKPTSQKTNEYLYSRHIALKWPSPSASKLYPIQLGPLDTATLTTAKMRADGYDLRVILDGKETDRWLVDMDNANTYIWINVPFQAGVTDELITQIPASGSINSIEIGEGVYDMPDEGYVQIDNEIFSYTARDLAEEKLVGITRAIWGSSEAIHTVGDDVYWIQHELIIIYGNPNATQPSTDDNYEPDFSTAAADSDNTKWRYTSFGYLPRNDPCRAARSMLSGIWRPIGPYRNLDGDIDGYCYNGNQGAVAYGFHLEIGAYVVKRCGQVFGWRLDCPVAVENAAWVGGEKYSNTTESLGEDYWLAGLRYAERDTGYWRYQHKIPEPTVKDTWQSWSRAKDGTDWDPPGDAVALLVYWFDRTAVECTEMTVYFDASEAPVDLWFSENSDNYPLGVKFENQTAGEWINVEFNMGLNKTLTINCDENTVTYDGDNSSQLQAVETDDVRRRWLTLAPGSNTLKYTDPNTGNVTVDVSWRERFY